jgi:hypothetical protein
MHKTARARTVNFGGHTDIWEVSNGHNIKHSPYTVDLLAAKLDSQLVVNPRMRVIAASEILPPDNLRGDGFGRECGGRQELSCVIGGEIEAEKAILDASTISRGSGLLCCCLFLGQVAQCEYDRISVVIVGLGVIIEVQSLRKHTALAADILVSGDEVLAEPFDATLVQDDLLES